MAQINERKMFKNLKQLYCMSVCLVAATVLMVQIPIAVKEVVDLGFPEIRSDVHDFDSNESYLSEKTLRVGDAERKKLVQLNESEITQKRLAAREGYLKNYHRQTLNSLINSLAWIAIAGLFFAIHWALYKRENTNRN